MPEWYCSKTDVPCLRSMMNFTKHKLNNDPWYSAPFYTGPGGYKLQLRVDLPVSSAKGSQYISVGVCLMKGDNDDRLEWPFRESVDIKLLNWTEERRTTYSTPSPSPQLLTPPTHLIESWMEPQLDHLVLVYCTRESLHPTNN